MCMWCVVNPVQPASSAPSVSSWSFRAMTSGKTSVMCCQLFWLVLSQRAHQPFLRHFLHLLKTISLHKWTDTLHSNRGQWNRFIIVAWQQNKSVITVIFRALIALHLSLMQNATAVFWRRVSSESVVRNGCKWESFQQLAASFQTTCGSTQTQHHHGNSHEAWLLEFWFWIPCDAERWGKMGKAWKLNPHRLHPHRSHLRDGSCLGACVCNRDYRLRFICIADPKEISPSKRPSSWPHS